MKQVLFYKYIIRSARLLFQLLPRRERMIGERSYNTHINNALGTWGSTRLETHLKGYNGLSLGQHPLTLGTNVFPWVSEVELVIIISRS